VDLLSAAARKRSTRKNSRFEIISHLGRKTRVPHLATEIEKKLKKHSERITPFKH
jgi:hypothetical protein